MSGISAKENASATLRSEYTAQNKALLRAAEKAIAAAEKEIRRHVGEDDPELVHFLTGRAIAVALSALTTRDEECRFL